jgi:hypothetical protein
METIYFKDGELSQKQTRMRASCIECQCYTRTPIRHGWRFDCNKYPLRLTFSGYSNYNQYLNHTKGCPVKEDI